MTHLAGPELQAWVERGEGRDRVLAHLAECDVCSATVAETIRTAPAAAETQPDDDVFRERAYAVYPARRDWHGWPAAAIGVTALAAAIILLLVLPRRTASPLVPPQESTATRGTALQTSTPSGAAQYPLTFAWSSDIPAASYRIDVAEGSRTVASFTAAASPFTLSADARLTAGGDYRWRVIALDPAGEPLGEAPWRTFRLDPKP